MASALHITDEMSLNEETRLRDGNETGGSRRGGARQEVEDMSESFVMDQISFLTPS